jgi:hypothetical protein
MRRDLTGGQTLGDERANHVVTANIAVLLSGMATVATMQDAITGYHLTATARGVKILLPSIGILVGVTIAVRIGVAARVDVTVSPDIPVGLLSACPCGCSPERSPRGGRRPCRGAPK